MQDVSPIDREDFLTREDIHFLKERLKRRMLGWVSIGSAIALIPLIGSLTLTMQEWLIGFLIWLMIALFKFLDIYLPLARGKKEILRGVIAQRYDQAKRKRGRGDDDNEQRVFFINGKRLVVPDSLYKKYFTRDIVEFHYVGDIFLKDTLLERGERKYS